MELEIDRVLVQAIDEFNENSDDGKITMQPDFALMGQESQLDSLGLVRFLVTVEQKLEQEFGRYIAVMDDAGSDDASNPFATLGSLANHLSRLIENGS